MKLEYYVLNYNINKKELEYFNIFDHTYLYEKTLEFVKRYLSDISNYKCQFRDNDCKFGFSAFCEDIKHLIQYCMWSKREYEISVGDAFETDLSKYKKIDCYYQCIPNIEIICRDIIRQYLDIKDVKEE